MIIFKETEIMYMISYHISYIYMNERSIVGRDIQLTKDYTTGNATFKQKEVEGQLLRQSHVRMEN